MALSKYFLCTIPSPLLTFLIPYTIRLFSRVPSGIFHQLHPQIIKHVALTQAVLSLLCRSASLPDSGLALATAPKVPREVLANCSIHMVLPGTPAHLSAFLVVKHSGKRPTNRREKVCEQLGRPPVQEPKIAELLLTAEDYRGISRNRTSKPRYL